MSTYGTPGIRIEGDQTDRIGIRTLVLSSRWQASKWPLSFMAGVDAETPATPEVEGGMEYIGRETKPVPGGLRTFWTFTGISGDGKNVTFKTRANTLDYWFSPGFSQVDIALFPGLQGLLEEFGGYVSPEGEIQFPPTVDDGSVSSTNGTLARNTGAKKNPLFGQKDFLRMEGSYSVRYASFSKDGIGANEGKIIGTGALPGAAPSYSGRNWLKAPTQWQRRGPIYEIVECYWLSGPGGWPKALYGGNLYAPPDE